MHDEALAPLDATSLKCAPRPTATTSDTHPLTPSLAHRFPHTAASRTMRTATGTMAMAASYTEADIIALVKENDYLNLELCARPSRHAYDALQQRCRDLVQAFKAKEMQQDANATRTVKDKPIQCRCPVCHYSW